MEPETKIPSLERIKRQARRITAMQELPACLANNKVKTPRWREEIRKQTKNTIEKLVRDIDLGNAKEKETPGTIVPGKAGDDDSLILLQQYHLQRRRVPQSLRVTASF